MRTLLARSSNGLPVMKALDWKINLRELDFLEGTRIGIKVIRGRASLEVENEEGLVSLGGQS